ARLGEDAHRRPGSDRRQHAAHGRHHAGTRAARAAELPLHADARADDRVRPGNQTARQAGRRDRLDRQAVQPRAVARNDRTRVVTERRFMASSREAITASDAPNEELSADWTTERQGAQMLELCEAQMESALTEADRAVDSLVKAFTTLADTASSIGALAKQSAADGQLPDLQRQAAAIREQ